MRDKAFLDDTSRYPLLLRYVAVLLATPSVIRHESPRRRALPPSSDLQVARLRLIRSAACYAELALLAGTWGPATMEARVENKGVHINHVADRTSKYSRYRKGVVPRKETFDALTENEYSVVSLRYWTNHPIGVLLLSPKLSHEQILIILESLPEGEARQLLWDEHGGARREVPDSEELIDELVALQSIDGLIAILGRLRIRTLLGQTEDIDLYETALLDCFPEVVARSVHLSIARYSLMQALSDFLDWQCGWAEIRRKVDGKSNSVDTGKFWLSLWQRFEEASRKTSPDWSPELDAEQISNQKRMDDQLELDKPVSPSRKRTKKR